MKTYVRVAETSLRRVALGSTVCEGVQAPDRIERLDRPAKVRTLAEKLIGASPVELFVAFGLDARHEVVAHWIVGQGTLMSCNVHPREVFGPVFRPLIGLGVCAALVVAHNHPSGDPEPSGEDIAVTKRLVECGVLLGIPLLDHVIIGDGHWCSLRERGCF